jgi:hypothetical protein
MVEPCGVVTGVPAAKGTATVKGTRDVCCGTKHLGTAAIRDVAAPGPEFDAGQLVRQWTVNASQQPACHSSLLQPPRTETSKVHASAIPSSSSRPQPVPPALLLPPPSARLSSPRPLPRCGSSGRVDIHPLCIGFFFRW